MRRFSFRLLALGFLVGAIIGTAATVGNAVAARVAPGTATTSSTQAPDQVIQWNRILLGISARPALSRPRFTRPGAWR
jgi:hypothetical protein